MILLHETSKEKKKKLFDSMEKKINEIVTVVNSHEYHAVETGTMTDRILRTGILYRCFSPFIKQMDNKFKMDQGCISCGLCSQVCPVHNIEIKNGIPTWKHQCEMCLACLNLCPKQVIQYKNLSEGKQRYKNPYVEVKDLMRR
ncbi:EFR1 family ferrodoxin [Clostridium sp. KNHs205]|jgi:ferredoxin|uniref:EFR1 family ferrodoxin n=1 Tax=Clostridium sp. KNHs205 TaxID=1449050 RepID=UPI000691A32C|nr:EFR1 family ferrodoxin [Clostridium sp. KNHs205]